MSDDSLLSFSININDAEPPKALPAGEYPITCISAKKGVSKSTGNPKIELMYEIARADFPPTFDPGEGVESIKLTHHVTTRDIPDDWWRLKKVTQAFGVAVSSAGVDINEFVGRNARLRTKVEKDQEGNDRASIDALLAR